MKVTEYRKEALKTLKGIEEKRIVKGNGITLYSSEKASNKLEALKEAEKTLNKRAQRMAYGWFNA